MLFHRRVFFLFLISCLICSCTGDDDDTSWDPSLRSQVARRSQRDISLNQTIDQLTYSGVNLNEQLWDKHGYEVSTLSTLKGYLNIGINSLLMDVYWNEKHHTWQFCPEAYSPNITDIHEVQNLGNYKCQLGLNLTMVFDTINTYLEDTNTQINVNIVELFFNIKSIKPKFNYAVVNSKRSLSSTLAESVSGLYSPSDRLDDEKADVVGAGEFPLLNEFLYTKYKRVLPIVLSNELPPNSSYGNLTETDGNSLFIDGYNVNITKLSVQDINTNTKLSTDIEQMSKEKFRLITDSSSKDKFIANSVEELMHMGYSPILSTGSEISVVEFEYNSLWSWIENQPDTTLPVYEIHSNLTNSNKRQIANKCGVLYDSGWVVDNCYNERPVACKNTTADFDWQISLEKSTYFSANCPSGFVFSLPRNALQNRALIQAIESQGIVDPIWIDVNSITVIECWVTGGPYAACPYSTVLTNKLFVGMITPASVVLLILIAMIIGLKFDKTPIQKNRRHWKKLINEFNEQDYEGIPS